MVLSKYDLHLDGSVMNAAGSLGFAPHPHASAEPGFPAFFVTNPISLPPRKPANPPRLLSFEGGVLLHTGHPNPGLRSAVKRFGRRWARSSVPVLVHLLAESPQSLGECLQMLEQIEGVAGVEVGLAPDIDLETLGEITRTAQSELPLIFQLPFEKAAGLAGEAVELGAAAISLAPPRGALVGAGGQQVTGRLYGPAIFPFALGLVARLADAGYPIIGSGGIYTEEDVKDMLDAGCLAVQLDTVLWQGGLASYNFNAPGGSSSAHR